MKIYYFVPFLMAATIPVSAQFTTFDANSSQRTYGTSINASGVVVGHYFDGYNVGHGFVRDAQGNITSFDASDTALTSTFANSVNASGVIAGSIASGPNGTMPVSGFVRDAQGNIALINAGPGNDTSSATGINSSGAIAGTFGPSGGNMSLGGFVRDPQGNITLFYLPFAADPCCILSAAGINDSGTVSGAFLAADMLDGPYGFLFNAQGNFASFLLSSDGITVPTGINDSGVTTGIYAANKGSGPLGNFVRDAQGNFTTFNVPGNTSAPERGINSINSSGAIVGSFINAANVQEGFVRDPQGNITIFNPPQSSSITPYSINDSGAITGTYSTGSGGTLGFVARVPNTMDLSEKTGPVSKDVWQAANQTGVSNVIVQAWDGGAKNTHAQGQLLGAQSNGMATGASILLNYFDKEPAAYQVGQGIAAIGTALSNLKFIVLEVEACCGEFISWQASTTYATGGLITDPAGHIQEVTTAGTSGPAAPAWNDAGGTTSDGTVVWQDTGNVLIGKAARVARISQAVSAIQAYNLPHGVVIYTDGQKGGWQNITGGCGTGATNNCSSLIALPLWDSEHKAFNGGDGLSHCGDGIAGLYGFTPYSPTTWQTRSGNQYDFGLAPASSGGAPACQGETGLFGLRGAATLQLDYFDPTLFQ